MERASLSSSRQTVDFYAAEQHYADHLTPIYHALPPEMRGRFVMRSEYLRDSDGDAVVVAAYRNLRPFRRYRRRILLEHGAGQRYTDVDHPAYTGGPREEYDLYLAPSQEVADRETWANEAEAIGCPKLDYWLSDGLRSWVRFGKGRPTVVVSFHWDCQVSPEAGTAFYEYREAVIELAKHVSLYVHAHPRFQEKVWAWATANNLRLASHFDKALQYADLYVCDNSSTIFEFAATGRPVVLLNKKEWRRDVDHGLRFWEFADVGVQVDDPGELTEKVWQALKDPSEQRARRLEVTRQVYAYTDATSSTRAAEAILRTLST